MSEHFSGHDLEAGLLQRARSWRDVLPPLVMLQSLRVTGSPVYVAIWLATVIILSAVIPGNFIESRDGDWAISSPFMRLNVPAPGTTYPDSIEEAGWLYVIVLIAIFPIAMTLRAGALYAAGRDSESLISSIQLIGRRMVALLLVAVLPAVCIAGLLVPIAMLALLEHVPRIGHALTQWLAIFVAPFAILVGLIGAGTLVAMPLGFASVAIEKRHDALDALSRGFEYLLRRPIQTLLYIAASWLLALVLGWLAQWVAYAGNQISRGLYALVADGERLPMPIQIIFEKLPLAVAMTTFFSLLGAVYLLLRQDANQQEIEDIAVSEIDRRKSSLPTLRDKKA